MEIAHPAIVFGKLKIWNFNKKAKGNGNPTSLSYDRVVYQNWLARERSIIVIRLRYEQACI